MTVLDPRISNLTELLLSGLSEQQRRHKDKEVDALGRLRAGNSGIASPDGDVAGQCHRRAHLRMLGIEVEQHSQDKLLMFELGIANEDIVYNKLLASLPEGYTILRESEIATRWKTALGTSVTGRPDLVIGKNDTSGTFIPELGIELKSVASVYTTAEILFEGRPKISHLIQAAHYMWQLGVPYRLNYKQYGNQLAPDWLSRKWPKEGQPGSEYLAYNPKGEVKYTMPYEITYELRFGAGGRLEYRREGTDEQAWVRTIVQAEDIRRFFDTADQMASKGLGRRPITMDAFGKEKSYSDCIYCPLQATCDKVDKVRGKVKVPLTYEQWLEEVRVLTTRTREEI